MPSYVEKEIRTRGGVVRFRTAVHGGKPFRVAVVRKPGPRGSRTIEYPIKRKPKRPRRLFCIR